MVAEKRTIIKPFRLTQQEAGRLRKQAQKNERIRVFMSSDFSKT